MTNIQAAQQGRANKTLDKVFRYPEGVMSRREWLTLMHSKGGTVNQEEVRDYNKEEREREYLQANVWNHPFGNTSHPATIAYNNRKAALAAGYFKTRYELCLPNQSGFWDLTKTEYDYFMALTKP